MLNDIKDALHSSFLIVIYKFYQLLLPAYCYNIQASITPFVKVRDNCVQSRD